MFILIAFIKRVSKLLCVNFLPFRIDRIHFKKIQPKLGEILDGLSSDMAIGAVLVFSGLKV